MTRQRVDLLGNEAEAARRGYRPPRELSLPQWYRSGDNRYFCGLIARQLRGRAMQLTEAGNLAGAAQCEAAAEIIEEGRFDWLR
jgi:hypothetical protein